MKNVGVIRKEGNKFQREINKLQGRRRNCQGHDRHWKEEKKELITNIWIQRATNNKDINKNIFFFGSLHYLTHRVNNKYHFLLFHK